VVEAQRAVIGERDPRTLNANAKLAFAYCKDGRLEKAVAPHETVLEGRKMALGDHRHLTVAAISNLDCMKADLQAASPCYALGVGLRGRLV